MDQTGEFPEHQEALSFLSSRINYERLADIPYRSPEFKLDCMRELLRRIGDPHIGMKIVHVAGTKGKGSTAAMISAILSAAGYRTGLYTSPHLERVEERAAIDGVACTAGELVNLVESIRPVAESMDAEAASQLHSRGPTFFEITTAMSLLHFARRCVDIAVLEVGLGGRFDSTNVCDPLVSVITSISFDHTKLLGNTLAQIAREKAGIIKRRVPVVSGVTQSEPSAVIQQVASENESPLFKAGQDFTFDYLPHELHDPTRPHWSAMDFRGLGQNQATLLPRIELGLIGKHQAANAAVAIAVVEQLRKLNWTIDDHAIRRGISELQFPARIEFMPTQPPVVLDSAHNVASAAALIQALDEQFDMRRRMLIFATSRDKDVRGMFRELLPHFDRILLTRYVTNPRHVMPEKLLDIATKQLAPGTSIDPQAIMTFDDPTDAWRMACEIAESDQLICIAGSVFIAAELRPLVVELQQLQVVDGTSLC